MDELTAPKPPVVGPTVPGPVGGGVNLPLPTVGGATPGGAGGGGWGQNAGALATGLGTLWGAYNQNQTNNANQGAQQAQLDLLNARQAQVTDYVNQFLQPGQNQFSQALMQMFGAQPQQAAGSAMGQMPVAGGMGVPAGGAPGIHQQLAQRIAGQGAANTPGFTMPGFQAPGQINAGMFNPAQIDTSGFGAQALNPGQDSLLQMMRAGPRISEDPQTAAALRDIIGNQGNRFDTSNLFGALDQQFNRDMERQLSGLSGSFGSFGERLGTSAMNQQGRLRADMLGQANVQRQGIAMQSFNDAQSRLMGALGLSSQNLNAQNAANLGGYQAQGSLAQAAAGNQQGQMGLLAQLLQANAAAQNQGGQFNISNQMMAQQANNASGQNWNQFMLAGLGQANAMQQAQSGQNVNLLAILAGLQPGNAPVQQPNALPGAIGDIGQLMMLLPYLRR